MLKIIDRIVLGKIAGWGPVNDSWCAVSDPRSFNAGPQLFFDRPLHGTLYKLDALEDEIVKKNIKECLYQVVEAYTGEIKRLESDLVVGRFYKTPASYWVIAETKSNNFVAEVMDVLEGFITIVPVYRGPLDFSRQCFYGFND